MKEGQVTAGNTSPFISADIQGLSSSITIANSEFEDCSAVGSSGVVRISSETASSGIALSVTDTTATGCVGNGGPGFLLIYGYSGDTNQCTINAADVTITDNTAQASPFSGAVFTHACFLNLNRVVMERNSGHSAGALFASIPAPLRADLSVVDSTFRDNTGLEVGGAITTSAWLNVTRSTFSGNRGVEGGAIQTTSEFPLFVTHSTFDANTASDDGGALFSYGEATLRDVTMSNNVAKFKGGAFVAVSDSWLEACTITANSATNHTSEGGGIHSTLGTLSLWSSSLTSNYADRGGAIYSNSPIKLNQVTMTSNSARVSGGGLYATGEIAVSHTTISNGAAGEEGGGVWIQQVRDDANFTSVDITSNSAAAGGGFYVLGSELAQVRLIDVAISDNEGWRAQSGALHVEDADVYTASSVVCANKSPSCSLNVWCTARARTTGLANGCRVRDTCSHGASVCAKPNLGTEPCSECWPGWEGPSCDIRTNCAAPNFGGQCALGTVCQQCMPGFAFEDDRKVKCTRCSELPFPAYVASSDAPCAACDPSCASCDGSSTQCTACAPGYNAPMGLPGPCLPPSPPPPPAPCPGDIVLDGCGVCGGDNSTCAGCDGVPNSGLAVDVCGICGGDGTCPPAAIKASPNTAAAAGIGIAATVGVCCIIAVLVVLLMRKRKRDYENTIEHKQMVESDLAPSGRVTVLAATVEDLAYWMENYPEDMPKALDDVADVYADAIVAAGGYLARQDKTDGSLVVIFESPTSAVRAASLIQSSLLEVQWSAALLEDKKYPPKGVLFRGLRISMGLFECIPTREFDPETVRMTYSGKDYEAGLILGAAGAGGQVLMDATVAATAMRAGSRAEHVGNYKIAPPKTGSQSGSSDEVDDDSDDSNSSNLEDEEHVYSLFQLIIDSLEERADMFKDRQLRGLKATQAFGYGGDEALAEANRGDNFDGDWFDSGDDRSCEDDFDRPPPIRRKPALNFDASVADVLRQQRTKPASKTADDGDFASKMLSAGNADDSGSRGSSTLSRAMSTRGPRMMPGASVSNLEMSLAPGGMGASRAFGSMVLPQGQGAARSSTQPAPLLSAALARAQMARQGSVALGRQNSSAMRRQNSSAMRRQNSSSMRRQNSRGGVGGGGNSLAARKAKLAHKKNQQQLSGGATQV
ncbi:uncharacterized protein AMSG_11071 [Thecamonas trahens ATCC 50062]|uniref:Guanylate cyclase domain-containing protein n=1 Tax=Thecamonas trahens ATCC 50062 TaxID=461836 RepID=A0A0L0DT11_THETB|nr:hypothetical protein AMSG_11071 [Thecamonas trahens ATCC 50062]KNC55410.1 hypothetical protein AMSG_11071 [Thecamonas trahens ATCC 50062]|eukprot:XP_013752949.1 hypothetical protein AMSG_11071 [Thecamonas trahens ATCC 50062]